MRKGPVMILLPCPWCGPREATEFAHVVITIAVVAVRQPQVVIAIQLVVGIPSSSMMSIRRKAIVITRIVIARIEIHDLSSGR